MAARLKTALACLACLALAIATLDCQCSTPSQDREKRLKEINWLEAWNYWSLSPRPEPQGFGCEYCPYMCTKLKLELHPTPRLMAAYRREAMRHTSTDEYGSSWQQIEGIACIVKAGGPPLVAEFAKLLHDPEPAVRYCAAVHAIHYGMVVDEAVIALRELVAFGEDERWRLDAWMQLSAWENETEVEL